MPDPAAVVGSEKVRHQAFRDTVHYLSRRIDLLLALTIDSSVARAAFADDTLTYALRADL